VAIRMLSKRPSDPKENGKQKNINWSVFQIHSLASSHTPPPDFSVPNKKESSNKLQQTTYTIRTFARISIQIARNSK